MGVLNPSPEEQADQRRTAETLGEAEDAEVERHDNIPSPEVVAVRACEQSEAWGYSACPLNALQLLGLMKRLYTRGRQNG